MKENKEKNSFETELEKVGDKFKVKIKAFGEKAIDKLPFIIMSACLIFLVITIWKLIELSTKVVDQSNAIENNWVILILILALIGSLVILIGFGISKLTKTEPK